MIHPAEVRDFTIEKFSSSDYKYFPEDNIEVFELIKKNY